MRVSHAQCVRVEIPAIHKRAIKSRESQLEVFIDHPCEWI